MTRRSGMTLVEVLVAIFVMGIGMLALSTLFPLGALRMQKAIQDQRCVEAAANASSVWTMKSIYSDAGLSNPSDPFLNPESAAAIPRLQFADRSPSQSPACARHARLD